MLKKKKKGQVVCLDWHGNFFGPDLCVGLVAWRERNNQDAVRSLSYNNSWYTPIMSLKNIRDQESDYWVTSCLKNIKNTQSKEFPEKCKTNFSLCCVPMRCWLWANSGVPGCSCSSASGSLPARSMLQDRGIYCWDDTPASASASLNPPENCSSNEPLKNVPVNLLFTQSWVEPTSPDPPQ